MRRISIILTALALLAVGCGGGGPDPAENPKEALVSAFENMADYEGITAVLSVHSDTDSLVASEMSAKDAETLLASSVTLSSKNTDDPEEAEFEMNLNIDGDLIEMKAVGTTLYARADVRQLVERFGGDQREVDQMVQNAPPQMEFVGPAAEGEWIAIEGAQEFTESLAGGRSEEENQELQRQLAEDLRRAIDENAEVTSEGESDIGHHLIATASLREMYGAVARSFPGGAGLPGGKLPDAGEVPDEQVSVDFWVADDRVEQIQLDLTQFGRYEGAEIPEGVEQMSLVIDLEEFTDGVEAPEAAASVDFQELMQTFGGLPGLDGGMGAGQGAGQPGAPADLCEQLAGAPPEVIEEFAEECPELQQ